MNISNLTINFFAHTDPHVPDVLENDTPGAYTTAIPGVPPENVVRFAIIMSVVLIVLVAIIQYIAKKKLISPIPAESGKKRILYTIITNIFLVIFYFVALELSLQIYVKYHPYQNFIPDNVLFWKPKPGVKGIMVDKNNPDSSYGGLLAIRHSMKKPEGTVRILCLGDSRTAGNVEPPATYRTCYPEQIQEMLNKEYTDIKIQALNGGVPGYTSYQGLFMLKDIVNLYKPDIVTLAFDIHDGDMSYASDSDAIVKSKFIQIVRKALYNSQIYLLLRRYILRKKLKFTSDKRPIFLRVGYDEYRDNMNEIIKMGNQHNFEVVFITLPIAPKKNPELVSPHTVAPYLKILREMSKDKDILYIDLNREVLNSKDKTLPDKLLKKDRVHFTVWGRKWLATRISEELKKNGIIERAYKRLSK